MANRQEKIYSKPIKFFRIVWTNNIESGELELPRAFVEMLGKNMPKHVTLKVPTEEETQIEVKMSEGKAWLHKGWQEFIDKYSLKCGSFINFQYHGGSRFDVIIFHFGCTEILYPIKSPNTRDSIEVSDDKSSDESADESADGSSDECPQKVQKGKGMKKNARKLRADDARARVFEKANTLDSPYPHFNITMTPTYVSGTSYLYVPIGPAKRYFFGEKNRNILLHHKGKPWDMEFTVMDSLRSVKIIAGWNEFVQGNDLKAGDVCAFELVKRKPMEFDITIFRIGDEEEEEEEEESVRPRTLARSGLRRRKAMKRLLKSVKSFKSNNPIFTIHMNSTYIRRASVHVPSTHAKKYLKNDKHGENAITVYGPDGTRWKIYYYHRLRYQDPHTKKILLIDGWLDFVRANLLAKGDIVVFERMSGKAKVYKVHLFRLGDHEGSKRAD